MVVARPGTPRNSQVAVAAFLRVYEPLEALPNMPAAQRKGWRAVVASGEPAGALRGGGLAAREHAAALRAASALPPRMVSDLDLADARDPAAGLPGVLLSPAAADGAPRVCPADLGWRALLALETLRLTLQPSVLYAFMPPAVVDEAARRLAVSAPRGSRSVHVRSSSWYIPLSWFAVFQPEQRRLEDSPADDVVASTGADDEPSQADADRVGPSVRSVARTVRYLAPMADARRCVARALAAVRRTPTELLAVADLERLGRWLEEFHARSVVELDYGGVAGLIPDAELAADESVAAVAAGVADLRAGCLDEAVRHLTVVRDRWAAVRALERAS